MTRVEVEKIQNLAAKFTKSPRGSNLGATDRSNRQETGEVKVEREESGFNSGTMQGSLLRTA